MSKVEEKNAQKEEPKFGFNTNLKEVDAETRAFIYQNIQQFEEYIEQGSTVGVNVSQKDRSGKFNVTLRLGSEGGVLQSAGSGKSIYEAVTIAKEKLLQSLVEIHNHIVSSSERDQEIRRALNHPYLH